MAYPVKTAQSNLAIRRFRPPAIVALAGIAGLTALAANAAPITEATATRDLGEPIMAIVSIKSQQVIFYDSEGWIYRAPVSTGTTGRETPAGIFAVVEKDKDHHSTMYDDASMPNMQRITWNGIALHGGPLPGFAASHGCIRMPYPFAEKMFDKTRLGMRIIISPNDAAPLDFTDPKLFQPNAEAMAAAPGRAETLGRTAADAAKVAEEAKKAATAAASKTPTLTMAVRQLEWNKKAADNEASYAEKAFTAAEQAKARAEEQKQKAAAKVADLAKQIEAAKADLKTKQTAAAAATDAAKATDAQKAAATKTDDEAKKAAATATREVATLNEQLTRLDMLKKSADADLVSTDKALAAADQAKAKAEEAKQKAATKVADLAKQIETAKADLKAKQDAATAALAAAKTDEQKKAAAALAREAAILQESLRKQEFLKNSADAELASADKTLTAANQNKTQAAQAKEKATAKVADLVKQIETGKADLKTKVAAAAAATDAAKATEAKKVEATKTDDEAKKVAATAAREVATLTESLGKLDYLKKTADNELAYADNALKGATQVKTQAEDQKKKTAAKAADVGQQLEKAKADVKANQELVAATKEALKVADAKKVETGKAALQAKLALEPFSIYISRATQKIYVRRNTHKPAPDGGGEVFDSIEFPVTIRDPGKPLGTHIFTAMARNGDGLRWTAVTIDAGDDAKSALDRITIPQEVLDRIAPTVLPRSSIAISDEPLSAETNYRTEFVVVLANQPQGGFITRKPTPREDKIAVRDTRDDGFFSFFGRSEPDPRDPRARRGQDNRVQQQQRDWWQRDQDDRVQRRWW